MATKERKGSVDYNAKATSRANSLIGIEIAPGIALGPDGYFHPVEVDADGQTRALDKTTNELLEQLILEVQALRLGMVAAGTCADITLGF